MGHCKPANFNISHEVSTELSLCFVLLWFCFILLWVFCFSVVLFCFVVVLFCFAVVLYCFAVVLFCFAVVLFRFTAQRASNAEMFPFDDVIMESEWCGIIVSSGDDNSLKFRGISLHVVITESFNSNIS